MMMTCLLVVAILATAPDDLKKQNSHVAFDAGQFIQHCCADVYRNQYSGLNDLCQSQHGVGVGLGGSEDWEILEYLKENGGGFLYWALFLAMFAKMFLLISAETTVKKKS